MYLLLGMPPLLSYSLRCLNSPYFPSEPWFQTTGVTLPPMTNASRSDDLALVTRTVAVGRVIEQQENRRMGAGKSEYICLFTAAIKSIDCHVDTDSGET